MDRENLSAILVAHKEWLGSGGKRGVQANLSGANLRWADLDFSCLPLQCSGLGAKVDGRLAKQFTYHALHYALLVNAPGVTQELLDWTNEFHRVGDVPRLKLNL